MGNEWMMKYTSGGRPLTPLRCVRGSDGQRLNSTGRLLGLRQV